MVNELDKNKPAEDITDSDRKHYRYWMNWVGRSEKLQPDKQWKNAEKSLSTKVGYDDEESYVDGFRLHYEALKSFLDQTEPSFRITPTKAFMQDPVSVKQAECDEAYIQSIWLEQKCQKAASQKLDSALIRNIGFTVPGFDKKKWMPTLRFWPAVDVLLDPDCNNQLDRAAVIAIKEPISFEQLKADNPDLTKEQLVKIKKAGHSTLDENEQEKLNVEFPNDDELYTVVEIIHIFAKDDAAVRKTDADPEDMPQKSVVEDLNLVTKRRYLQYVRGYPKALKDMDRWPYDIDDNEFPVTNLMFNTSTGNIYGFTDKGHMKKMDEMFQAIFKDVEKAAYWSGHKKFGGTPEAGDLTDADIQAWLQDPNTVLIKNALDSQGNQKIKWIDVGGLSNDLVQALTLSWEMLSKASGLNEMLDTDVAKLKDVTALAYRINDANAHQRINRRLSGPEGYEMSIADDAVKLLEIAHQFVPRYSILEIEVPDMEIGITGIPEETGTERKELVSLPWQQAQEYLMQPDVKLVQLGVDAIVGPDLAQYWRPADEFPVQVFKISTNVKVMPGSTRAVTKEQEAAILKQFYLEVFSPLYEAMGRFDLAIRFLTLMGPKAGVENIDDYLPTEDEAKQFQQQQEQMKQEQALEGKLK